MTLKRIQSLKHALNKSTNENRRDQDRVIQNAVLFLCVFTNDEAFQSLRVKKIK